MMNISVFGLISSSLISSSPLFVSNKMIITNCYFQRFTPLLFYNQQKLHINKATFQKGLGGIIIIDKAIDPLFSSKFTNDSFYGPYLTIVNNVSIINKQLDLQNQEYKAAYSITNCRFEGITVDNNPIIKFGSSSSSYFSDVLFFNCIGKEHLIKLDKSHCNTMTHICSFQNKVDIGADFSSSDFDKMDFFILTYSTFVGNSDSKSQYIIHSVGGSHYHRCQNFTNFYKANNEARMIFDMDAPYCCSHAFISFSNIHRNLYQITGSIKDSSTVVDGNQNKTIYFDKICAYDRIYENFFILGMHSGNSFFLTLSNLIFISNSENKKAFITYDNNVGSNNMNNYITLIDCYFSNNLDKYLTTPKSFFMDEASFIVVDKNNINYPDMAHYTTLYCDGIGFPDKPTLAHGCNVDKCIAEEYCNQTIGFPSNVAPYETIIHTDVQTATFTPSNHFSNSYVFSNSDEFSKSMNFTKSSFFSNSDAFSPSGKFSRTRFFSQSTFFSSSLSFSESFDFSKSSQFSKSGLFTNSNQFSSSTAFTESSYFTNSGNFTNSEYFTYSSAFEKSLEFTKSNDFSKTMMFSETNKFSSSFYFSNTDGFTETKKFSNSEQFTTSKIFSPSNNWNETQTFTPSIVFSYSDQFSKSKCFSKSNDFIKTDEFSKSSVFSISKLFLESDEFSKSSYFSNSKHFQSTEFFSKSNDFSKTDGFTKSNVFSNSKQFSESDDFTKSSYFSNSNHFKSTLYFTTSSDFTKSNEFSKSTDFSDSKEFSESNAFTISNYFLPSPKFLNSDKFNSSEVFTSSSIFTKSNKFNSSEVFSKSNQFSATKTMEEKSHVVINIKQEDSQRISIGIKAGIGVIIGGIAVAAIAISIIILRRRKMANVDVLDENIEIIEDETNSIVTQNPLMTLMDEDDPFENEFDL